MKHKTIKHKLRFKKKRFQNEQQPCHSLVITVRFEHSLSEFHFKNSFQNSL